MIGINDPQLAWLLAGVFAALTCSSVIGLVLQRTARSDAAAATVDNINARIRGWWMMVIIFTLALLTGGTGSVVLFALTSFFALREYITLTQTSRADHRALFWMFFIVLPVQYVLVGMRWYGLFSVFIPVYAYIFIATRIVLAGSSEAFLARTSSIQWGLMVCIYFISHVPALLLLDIPGYAGQAKLLFFLVTVVELSDVLQYVWGKTLGKRKIAPGISPNKTWEGFVGGTLSASLVGCALYSFTPFSPQAALLLSIVITMMGFAGGLVMSAIKRDRGVKDWGTLIQGHGGMLDRIDSLCFAAPVFFHLVRYFYT